MTLIDGLGDAAAGADRAGEADRRGCPCESRIAWPTTEPLPMTRLRTPFGRPARWRMSTMRPGAARHEVGGLDDDGVAPGERRGDLPRRDGDREVPGRDQPDRADRLAGDLDADARADRGQDLAGRGAGTRRRRSRRSARRGWSRRCPRRGSCPPRGRGGVPSSSLRARISAAAFERTAWRSSGPERLQAGKAALAAAMARVASSAVARAYSPTTSAVFAGLTFGDGLAVNPFAVDQIPMHRH